MYTATVLIVDDSPTVRKIVQLTLQRENIQVIQASDGLAGLAAVTDYQPDLILLDIVLPHHMDGYTICQIIRHKQGLRDIPIIMLSARDSLVDRMRGRMVGATEYLTKPFDAAELVETIRRHLGQPRSSDPGNARFRP